MPQQQATRGTVKYWNPKKCFGFMTSDSGEKIFFHATGRSSPEVYTHGYTRFEQELLLADYSTNRTEVRVNDRLVFWRRETAKGVQASKWTFEADWDAALQRLVTPKYRVSRARIYIGKKAVKSQDVIFEGTLEEMEATFPDREAFEPIVQSTVEVRTVIEIDTGNGWEIWTQDPRHHSYRSLVRS